ncbi:MAG: hypothetical protein LBF50_08890 [Azoarcus sp.]|jgi:hypothetical protein|nr:hypothetical protein [Azoarcus sp.]
MSGDCVTFLGLEPRIIERLARSGLPDDGVKILSIADVADATEQSLPKPSVRVAFGGYTIVQDATPLPPGWARIEQTWLVVPAVRNVREMTTGVAARHDASNLIDRVFDALEGWNPGDGYGVLKAATPGYRPVALDGSLYVPLAFTSTFRRHTTCE